MTNKSQKQSIFFSLLLFLLPILSLNIGYKFIDSIDKKFYNQKRKDAALLELQSMTYASDFEFQFSKYANSFGNCLKTLAKNLDNQEKFYKLIESESSRIFESPFPEYDLFVFHIPQNAKKSDLIYKKAIGKNFGKREVSRVFDYLVKTHRNDKSAKSDESFAKNLFKSIIEVSVYGKDQKGKATFCLYNLISHRFIWNYYEIDKKGTFGYFLLCKNLEEYEQNAKKLFFKEKNKERVSESSYLKGAIRAYIPIFEGYGSPIYQNKALTKNKQYQKWEQSLNFPIKLSDIEKKETDGFDSEIKFQNFNIYTFAGKMKSHLSALVVPIKENNNISKHLWYINLFYVSAIFLLIIRRLIFGTWIKLSLKYRFTINFLLAAILPLSLFYILAYAYIKDSEESSKQQQLSDLQTSLNEFESRKEYLWEKYKKLIFATAENQKLIDQIKANKTADCEQVNQTMLSIFNDEFDMPIDKVYLIDQELNGTVLAKDENIQNKTNAYKHVLKCIHDKSIFDHDAFALPLSRITVPVSDIKNNPKYSKEEKHQIIRERRNAIHKKNLTELAFSSANEKELCELIEDNKERILIIDLENGIRKLQTYRIVNISEKLIYALGLSWKDEDLDFTAYSHTQSNITLNKPYFSFIAFQQTTEGFATFSDIEQFKITNKTSNNAAIAEEAKKLAQTAFLQKASLTKELDNIYLSAMPTKKYKDIVIVGACDMSNAQQEILIKQLIIVMTLALSFLVVLFCVYITLKIILDPISALKQALDKISSGNLNIEIKSNNKDEIGNLCNAFQSMTKGLRDRKKLATLISDQAIDALNSGTLKTEKFKGVALVSDIRNFTSACETYNPTLITDLLNKHFAEMSAIISKYGGRIYKFIGDAIESVFPENGQYEENASNRALKAAIEMVRKLQDINKQRKSDGLFSYKIGIGLKYGEMFSDTVGSVDTRLDYAIFGEPLIIAAKLEALSKQNPDCPIVMDEYIKNELTNNYLNFIDIESKDYKAFSLNKILEHSQQSNISNSDTEAKTKLINEATNKSNKLEQIYTYSKYNYFSRKSLFVGIFIFISIMIFLFCASFNYITKTQIKHFIEQKTEVNKRLIEQFKTSDLHLNIFENNARQIIAEIENRYKNKSIIGKYTKELEEKYKYGINIEEYIDDRKIRLRCTSTKNNDTVFVYNDYNTVLNKNTPLFISISVDKGYFFNTIKNQFVNAFSNLRENVHIAINEENEPEEKWVYSDGFDPSILKSDKTIKNNYVISTSNDNIGDIKINNKKYNAIVASKIPDTYRKNFETAKHIFIAIFIISLFALIQIYREKTIINSSLRSKLWLSLISVAIIPMQALFILYNLYTTETSKKQIQYLKSNTQQFEQNFELKNNFSIPAATKKISLISNSPELKNVINSYIKEKSNSEKNTAEREISKFFLANNTKNQYKNTNFGDFKIKKRDKADPINEETHTKIIEIVLSGFDWAVSFRKSLNNNYFGSEFSELYSEIGKEINKLSSANKTKNPNEISEIAKSTKMSEGLKFLRSIFGSDIYVKLANSINSPFTFTVGDAIFAAYLQVVPKIKKSDFTIFWMISFDKKINEIAERYNTEKDVENDYKTKKSKSSDYYRLFNEAINSFINPLPEIQYRAYPGPVGSYGKVSINDCEISDYEKNNFNRNIVKYASYIATSKIPLNETFNANGTTYYCHGKICENIPDRLMLITSDLKPMFERNKTIQQCFYYFMLIAISLVFCIAHNVARDILNPISQLIYGIREVDKEHYRYRIKTSREDELGMLCQSFNAMIRGLEEKQLMGKMVSETAQKISLNNNGETSRKADCVLLYVTVKDFSEKAKTISPQNLINELKLQVELISRSVLEEGGEIDKIMGEKQLIAFHTFDKSLKESIKAACKAALSIKEKERNGTLPFNTAIGISYGSVITGFLGVGEKRDFTVIGDPVNIAARIASYAEKQTEATCLISGSVFDIAKSDFESIFIGDIPLKGKSMPISVFNLTGIRNNA